MGNLKDFATAIVQVAPSPATSGTELKVQSGQGQRLPETPFFATVHPDGQVPTLDNAEKVQVTNVNGDTLTIVRAQGGTQAQAIGIGWRLSRAIFADDIPQDPDDLDDTNTEHKFVSQEDKDKLAALTSILPNYNVPIPAANVIMLDDLSSGWSDEYGTGVVNNINNGQIEGAGAISVTVPNNGGVAGMSKTGTWDFSKANFRLWLKSNDWENVGSANILLLTDSENLYTLHIKDFLEDLEDDEWYEVVFTRDQFSAVGSPSWDNITKIVLRAWTTTGGTPTVLFDGFAAYPQAQRGVISICFDDGWLSAYTEGYKKMADYNYQGTQFIIPGLLGQSGRMTQEQVDDLHRKGWDISGHGATDLTSLTTEQVEADLKETATYLNIHGYRGAHLYAYPNGQNTQAVRDIVQKYFPVARTINSLNQPLSYINPLRINALSLVSSTPVATIQARIDSALENGSWLILVFHKIVATPTVETEYSVANFSTIVDYLKSKNADVQPISRVLARSDFFIKDASGANVSDAGGLIVVNHGSNSNTARPSVSGPVFWIGSAEPSNALDNDIWYDTSS